MSRMKASVFPGARRNISNVGVVISAAGSFAAAGTASINAKATSDKPRNIGFSHPILRVLTLRIVPLHPPGDKRESGSQVRQSGKFRAARTRRDYPLFADPAPYRDRRASCRERVCKYRVTLGGRRIIKKKKNTKKEY